MTLKEILHYLDIHLKNSSPDTAVVNVGVNDLPDDNTHRNNDNYLKI